MLHIIIELFHFVNLLRTAINPPLFHENIRKEMCQSPKTTAEIALISAVVYSMGAYFGFVSPSDSVKTFRTASKYPYP
jgi:hypothetical protein